jgi:hypothetical protein
MWYVGNIPIVPRNYALVVNSFLWTAITFIFICMRLFTRAAIVKNLWWDDWLMTAAMVSFAFLGDLVILKGIGRLILMLTLHPMVLLNSISCYRHIA